MRYRVSRLCENVWGALQLYARVPSASEPPHHSPAKILGLSTSFSFPPSPPKTMASRTVFSRLAPALAHARSARSAQLVGARLARGYASQSEHTVCFCLISRPQSYQADSRR